MFTGLVEDVGTVASVRPEGNGHSLVIRTAIDTAGITLGASVAVDGVCLTATATTKDTFTAVAGRETVERSTLRHLRAGRKVHLEQALRVGDRLGGHLVQGHVDGVGQVLRSTSERESHVLWVELPREIERYVAAKGSICLDGVSLTVNQLDGLSARVNVVPHTAKSTRLGGLRAGDFLNIEVDILAKYVERMLEGRRDGLTLSFLQSKGFV